MKAEVVVIGAGVAGLACARDLAAAHVVTVVIEARDRIGGRILTLRLADEAPIEMGAQVVHGDRAATWSVIHDAGLSTALMSSLSDIAFHVEGRVWTVTDVERVRSPLPWTVERRLMESQTDDTAAEEIIDRSENRSLTRALSLEWLAQTWCADPAELSVAGMKQMREASDSGEGEFRLLDGYDRIPQELGQNLNVLLQKPVRLVRWHGGKVTIHTSDETFEARAAVLAVPPGVIAAGGIEFDPPLPPEKMNAANAIGAGGALVLVARLSKPSPRAVWALSVGGDGGFWRAEAGSHVVQGWIKGPAAKRANRHPLSAERVIKLTTGAFPWIKASDIIEIYTADWSNDPFARTGFSFPKVGSLDAPRQWAAPVDNLLFFSGEATCWQQHLGLVHGALESGQRAAAELIDALE